MPEALGPIFAALIAITVFATALGIGMDTSVHAIEQAMRRRILRWVIVVNVVVVPLVGLLVTNLLPLSSGSATGILLCAICAAGPMGLKAAQISRSDLNWALPLTILLLLLNVIALPAWTALVLDRALSLRPGDLFGVMVVVILVPVALGALIRRRAPLGADLWGPRATIFSNVTLVLAVLIGVVATADTLASAFTSWAVPGVVAVIAVSGLIATALPAESSIQRGTTLITMNRATSVALLVLGRSFSDSADAFTAVIVFGLVQTFVAISLGLVWSRARLSVPSPTV